MWWNHVQLGRGVLLLPLRYLQLDVLPRLVLLRRTVFWTLLCWWQRYHGWHRFNSLLLCDPAHSTCLLLYMWVHVMRLQRKLLLYRYAPPHGWAQTKVGQRKPSCDGQCWRLVHDWTGGPSLGHGGDCFARLAKLCHAHVAANADTAATIERYSQLAHRPATALEPAQPRLGWACWFKQDFK